MSGPKDMAQLQFRAGAHVELHSFVSSCKDLNGVAGVLLKKRADDGRWLVRFKPKNEGEAQACRKHKGNCIWTKEVNCKLSDGFTEITEVDDSAGDSLMQHDCKEIARTLRSMDVHEDLIARVVSIAAQDRKGMSVAQDVDTFLSCFVKRRVEGCRDTGCMKQIFGNSSSGTLSDDELFTLTGRMVVNELIPNLQHKLWKWSKSDSQIYDNETRMRLSDEGGFDNSLEKILDEWVERMCEIAPHAEDRDVVMPDKPFSECSEEELISYLKKSEQYKKRTGQKQEDGAEEEINGIEKEWNSLSKQFRVRPQDRKEFRSLLLNECNSVKNEQLNFVAHAERMRHDLLTFRSDPRKLFNGDSRPSVFAGISRDLRKTEMSKEKRLDDDGHDASTGQSYKIKSLVPTDSDPSSLQLWPSAGCSSLTHSFMSNMFSKDEQLWLGASIKFPLWADQDDANYELRRAIYKIGKSYADAKSANVYDEAYNRCKLFELSTDTRHILLSIENVRKCVLHTGSKSDTNNVRNGEEPMFVVSWLYTSVAGQNAQKIENIVWMERRSSQKKEFMHCSEVTFDLFHSMLQLNRDQLHQDFCKDTEASLPKGIKVSVLTRIPIKPPQCESCAHCNKVPSSIKMCAKCGVVGYCNRHCQRAHWKEHKKTCSGCPSSIENNRNSSNILSQLKQSRNALQEARDNNRSDLDTAIELKNIGNVCLGQALYTEAIEHYKQAACLLSGCKVGSQEALELSMICANQAECHTNVKQPYRAVCLAQASVDYNDNSYNAHLRLASACSDIMQFGSAMHHAEQSYRLYILAGIDTSPIDNCIKAIQERIEMFSKLKEMDKAPHYQKMFTLFDQLLLTQYSEIE